MIISINDFFDEEKTVMDITMKNGDTYYAVNIIADAEPHIVAFDLNGDGKICRTVLREDVEHIDVYIQND